jgi:proline iminopeptidase
MASIRPYAALAGEGLQVVLYDQLGGGDADCPDDDALWTMARFVDEVEAVRTELDLGRVHVLGRSWGGMLALQHALDHPEAVASLVLSNTGASSIRMWRSITRRRLALPDEVLAGLLRHEADAAWDDPGYQDLVKRFSARHLRRAAPDPDGRFDEDRSLAEYDAAVGWLPDLGRPYRVMWGPNEMVLSGNLIGWDVTHRLGEIDVPALVIGGGHDEIGPEVHEELASGLRRAELVMVPDASHQIQFEASAATYLAAIAAFLRQ